MRKLIVTLALLSSAAFAEHPCKICSELGKKETPRFRHFLAGQDGVTNPTLKHKPLIEYPEAARVKRIEGKIQLQTLISTTGKVEEVYVLSCVAGKDCDRNCERSCEGLGFEEAAVETVRKWRYEPATRDGEPVAVHFSVYSSFTLH